MKITKLILLIIFTLFYTNNANAQSHTFMPGWCKLAKSNGRSVQSESAIHVCQVCNAKDKKEKDAKLAENNRRNQVIWDKAKADKIANDKASKAKQLEDAKHAHDGEVLINMPQRGKLTPNANSIPPENLKYTVVQDRNSPKEPNEEYYRTTHPVKILRGDKIMFQSNDYQSLRQATSGKLVFVLRAVSNLPDCKAEQSNNSILINEKGEQIPLPGITKFGILFYNKQNEDYFDIAVFTGRCTPVEDDRYAKGDFHTIKYTFSYKTMQLISSETSWQHANCECE